MSWTRDEVRAKLLSVIGPEEVETFMQGCGGDDSEKIGYRQLDATVGEIYGANFRLAKKIMKVFGFEYAGRTVPTLQGKIMESINEERNASCGDSSIQDISRKHLARVKAEYRKAIKSGISGDPATYIRDMIDNDFQSSIRQDLEAIGRNCHDDYAAVNLHLSTVVAYARR